MKAPLGFSSTCIRDAKDARTTPPHQLPIYATSSFELESIDQAIAVFQGREKGHVYGRYGNPTLDTVARKIAALETHGLELEAEALLFSSGMSAISTLLLAHLQQGEKILTQGNLYGGTTELFLKVLQPCGVEPIFTDLQDLDGVEALLQKEPDIRLLYFETPANPTLACVDMDALVKLARAYDCKTAIDNTFCTPYLQQPFRFGLDYIVHSTTKYLNGHGNSIAGALVGRDAAAMRGPIWQTMKLAGTNCNAWDAWLINNGLKTLALRMQRHSQNAQAVAEFLSEHERVARVNYLGLPGHPDYALASRQMRNGFGGMLSFELKGGLEAGMQFMRNIRFCTMAPTLGDVDTLILHPATSSHLNVDPAVREANGITDGLIRLSVGIEDVDDILLDLDQALASL